MSFWVVFSFGTQHEIDYEVICYEENLARFGTGGALWIDMNGYMGLVLGRKIDQDYILVMKEDK